jgi:hypothetical protein
VSAMRKTEDEAMTEPTTTITRPEPAPHVLVVKPDPTDSEHFLFEVECPGLKAGQCMCYWECEVEGCDPDDDAGMSHGVEHFYLADGWSTESEDCWVQNYDELYDAARDCFTAKVPFAPGRYLVRHVDEDGVILSLMMLGPEGLTAPEVTGA